jgi:hypothetical protein
MTALLKQLTGHLFKTKLGAVSAIARMKTKKRMNILNKKCDSSCAKNSNRKSALITTISQQQ